jgi:hypothetical protein
MIIVATELHVRRFWRIFEFTVLSTRSMHQAKKAAGCMYASARLKGWRIGFTLSAWENKEAMLQFRNTGAHKKAMLRIRKLSIRYKTVRWESDTLPSWQQAAENLNTAEFIRL